MKTILLLAVALTCLAASAQATEKPRCDAKPFTLKPAATPKPPVEQAVKPAPAPAKVAAAPVKPKTDCKKKTG